MRARAIAMVLLGLLAACNNPKRDKLKAGVDFAARRFDAVNRNIAAAAAFGSTFEMGGSLSTYLAANTPDKMELPPYADGRPPGPWSIALRGLDGDTIVVEGFGDTVDRPLLADTIVVKPFRRR